MFLGEGTPPAEAGKGIVVITGLKSILGCSFFIQNHQKKRVFLFIQEYSFLLI